MVHASSVSTQDAEAGGSHVQGQPELRSETLSTNKNRTNVKIVNFMLRLLQTVTALEAIGWLNNSRTVCCGGYLLY